jgi:DNA-binding LacI/PurR family transcriptional regulator/signal transduction histidine kinase/ActR/RegA family two-component response regulator
MPAQGRSQESGFSAVFQERQPAPEQARLCFGETTALDPPASHRQRGRKTIAVLIDYMDFFAGGYGTQIQNALSSRATTLDLNLLMVFGRGLDEPLRGCAAHNAIFEMIGPARADGVIVLSSLLSGSCGPEGLLHLVRHYSQLPVCSIGTEIPGIPTLTVDDGVGMRAAVEHLVRDHHCRRVAFITGSPGKVESETRLLAYREVLARHQIDLDPALVVPGAFMPSDGFDGVEALLKQGIEFDAIAAANDFMAMGAVAALRKHGRDVPRDVRVTGFDDLPLSRIGNPALTSVAQPFALMAEKAIEIVLDQVAGRPVAPRTQLMTEFVVRRSCGCRAGARRTKTPTSATPSACPREYLQAHIADFAASVASILQAGGMDCAHAPNALVTALKAELSGQPLSFARALEGLLDQAGESYPQYRALQDAVEWLREELRDFADLEIERLWADSFALIATADAAIQVQHRVTIDQNYRKLLVTGEQVGIAWDWESLERSLLRALPGAGVLTAFLSRFTDGSAKELQPFLCMLDGEPQSPLPFAFPAQELFPPDSHLDSRRRTLLAFPLVFETQRLGIAVFERLPETHGYQVLRDQLNVALRSIQIHQELLERTRLHERDELERLATAKRLESLSVLAGGVAHDLNNSLGPIVALPDLLLHQLAGLDPDGRESDMRADLESIKAASLRASQTIKDLLTLAGQGRVRKERVDLNAVVSKCIAEHSDFVASATNRSVEIVAQLPSKPLPVLASEAHLVRAISNLMRNGVEAIEGDGQLSIRAGELRLTEAMVGFERIEPGHYAVLSISDTGRGIPQEDVGRIFEPFFSTKPLGESSGTGLGLAIVHGVMKEHGGFVDVTSVRGQGTTFTLYFPRLPAEERVDAPHTPTPLPLGRPTILLVDDSPILLRTGRRVLEHLGYQVETLESGKEAYQRFVRAAATGRSPCDLVILDMSLLEERDGLEIFELIRQLFPSQRALLVSGHAPNNRVQAAMERGLGWLGKPYTMESLAETVARALEASPSK